jgi:hypothetical protein
MFAAAGLLVAVVIYFLVEWGVFQGADAFYFWPTSVLMLGLTGVVNERYAAFLTIVIIGSNAVVYFLIGLVMAPVVGRLRGTFARMKHPRQPR